MHIQRADKFGFALAIVLTAAFWGLNATVWRPRRDASTCSTHLKAIGLAMNQYIRDYDEHFALSRQWMPAIAPYMPARREEFRCAARSDLNFAYAMNARFSDVQLEKIVRPQREILVFESDINRRNAADSRIALPKIARHPVGHGVVFVDGHMAFLRAVK